MCKYGCVYMTVDGLVLFVTMKRVGHITYKTFLVYKIEIFPRHLCQAQQQYFPLTLYETAWFITGELRGIWIQILFFQGGTAARNTIRLVTRYSTPALLQTVYRTIPKLGRNNWSLRLRFGSQRLYIPPLFCNQVAKIGKLDGLKRLTTLESTEDGSMRLRFISIPVAGLFFISTVSTFLTLPTVKSLRSFTSPYHRSKPCKCGMSASEAEASVEPTGNKYLSVKKLAELCHTFATKNIKQSITTDRTQWVNDALFQKIVASLDATYFLTASTFGSFLLLSPFPTNSIIFQGNNYALSLLMIPRGVEVQLPTSDKYNTCIYKPLRGCGELRKQKGQNTPEVIRMNGNDDFNTLYSDILIEPGGDKRSFFSQHSNSGPSILLELSFNQGTAAGNHLLFFSWLPPSFFSFLTL